MSEPNKYFIYRADNMKPVSKIIKRKRDADEKCKVLNMYSRHEHKVGIAFYCKGDICETKPKLNYGKAVTE